MTLRFRYSILTSALLIASCGGGGGNKPDADSATFLGRPWNDIATLSVQVLEGASLDLIDAEIFSVVEALGPFLAPSIDFDNPFDLVENSGFEACTGGGEMTWRLTTQTNRADAGDTSAEYAFTQCVVGGVTLDGSFSSAHVANAARTSNLSFDSRSYNVSVIRSGAVRLEATGETGIRRVVDITAPCRPSSTLTATAVFGSTISVFDSDRGITIESLAASNVSTTETLRILPSCLTEFASVFNDAATYIDEQSGVTIEVLRRGTARFRTAEAAASGEIADSFVEIRVAGRPGTRLRIVSMPQNSESSQVTIEENGATVSFETSWSFAR